MGEHGAARRRVTAADIARSLGISRATVGYVLNNTPGQTISETTRMRVLEEAKHLGYRPHTAAQALARGRSRIILLVLPDWPVEHALAQNLEQAATALDLAGYSLVTHTRHTGGRARPLWELLNPDVVIGFGPFDADELVSMRANGITKIVPDPDRGSEEGGGVLESSVITAGTRLQVEHLTSLGHHRLAFAASPDPRLSILVEERIHTAQRTVDLLGLGTLDVRPVDYRDGSAAHAVHAWRDAGVTAVVAYNDDIAATVAGAALRAGLSMPGDLAVIGHDDTPLAAMFVPSLSSVRIDTVGLGHHIAELALHEADGRPLAQTLPDLRATVIVRESTGADPGCPGSKPTAS